MRIEVILNRDGGTLKTTDLDALTERFKSALSDAGHQCAVRNVSSKEIVGALEKAAGDKAVECIIVGGGDGSVSLAASLCWKHEKVLGILPAGTMNLFARSLGMPLNLDQAIIALADAEVCQADICTVNGHAFVHQVSIGVQPRMVELRKSIPYRSRLGKINASMKAAFQAMTNPPTFRARLMTGSMDSNNRFSILAISNNVFGDGHLPFADHVDRGTLGIYTSGPLSVPMNLRLARDLFLGRWTNNEHFLSQSTDFVRVEMISRIKGWKMSVDGELMPLPSTLDIRLHARALNVLQPSAAAEHGPVNNDTEKAATGAVSHDIRAPKPASGLQES